SFFGSLTDTVKSVVTPSWLTDLVRTVKRSSKNGESPTEEKGREEKEICSSNSSNLKPRTAEYGQLPSNSVPPRTDTFRGFTSGSPVSGNNYTFEVVSKKNESMNVYPSNVSQYKEEPAQVREPVSVEVVQNGGEGEMEHSMEPPSVKLIQHQNRKPAVSRI
ncbi:uncharacterized protein LOC134258081, partial [Saccostrea cucullata]|uniref:uncharacterized protein LOC134258081 n=1 Tax=Saccostrea cuccullata TaxID=36930 RepID=UPI002ED09A88